MLSIAEVRASILSTVPSLGVETVDYTEVVGRVLAESVVSPEDVPAFDNSAMDGYAVCGEDVSRPGAELEVVADLPAGMVASATVGRGQAIKIMTGAPIPEGADTVVRVEDTSGGNGRVTIGPVVATGTYVRPAGGDVRLGAEVIAAGARCGPAHVGMLAALGVTSPVVARRPRVAILSTGDELRPVETTTLEPGMIRDSNRPMMAALLADADAEVVDLGRVGDDADQLRSSLSRSVAEADVLITTGGVSMGDYDVVKAVLGDEPGVDFIGVAMSPGKPLGFGVVGGLPFFGLPGNPVSVVISFEQFVRPALLAMQGARHLLRPRAQGVAGETFSSDPAKEAFLRARIVDHRSLEVVATGGQGSNVLSGVAQADCFVVVPVGRDVIDAGEPVTLELFRAAESRGVDQ